MVEGVTLNVTANKEHAAEIERLNRTVKERFRAMCSTLPFNRLPARIIVELVAFCVLWLNSVPPKGGVSQYYSPRTILTGTMLDWTKHCRANFREYCETHDLSLIHI